MGCDILDPEHLQDGNLGSFWDVRDETFGKTWTLADLRRGWENRSISGNLSRPTCENRAALDHVSL